MTMIERERDELGGGATVDPVYVALTTQANEIGRRISQIARTRLDALEREGGAGSAAAQSERDTASLELPDSLPVLRARQEALSAYESARRSLDGARAQNAAADSAAARERAQVQMAPIPILLVAAIVLAATFAFAVSMLDEMRSPRVADGAEAERLTDLRVLGVARQRVVPADRLRRAADRTVPPSLDPTFDGYRVVAWHLAAQWPKDGIVTVTGDDMTIAATVAANLAAVMANDARVTLLIDSDLALEPVRTVLALPRSPGLVAVLENRRRWSESLIGVPVGRGRSLDILPSGVRAAPLGPAESQALVGEIQRAARRHDATIVVAPLAMVKRYRAGDDVVVCATETRTRLSTLARTVASLVDEGARVRGVVLWAGAPPAIPRDVRERARLLGRVIGVTAPASGGAYRGPVNGMRRDRVSDVECTARAAGGRRLSYPPRALAFPDASACQSSATPIASTTRWRSRPSITTSRSARERGSRTSRIRPTSR